MKKELLNKKWYSVIMSLLLIWFILLLSIWIYRLVLNEMKNNRAMWDYIKAYAWAESSQELALLEIKKYWYWYDWKIEDTINNKSVLISKNNLDKDLFHPIKDVLISYSNDWKVNSFDWLLRPLNYHIIPLFYIDDDFLEKKVNNIDIIINSWNNSNLAWNIVWKFSWISWLWIPLFWSEKKINSSWEFVYSQKNISEFLPYSTLNYLVLFNSWNSEPIEYRLKSIDTSEYFTKPELTIISTWEVWKFKQNLRTTVNNSEFLNILKYSIFSD